MTALGGRTGQEELVCKIGKALNDFNTQLSSSKHGSLAQVWLPEVGEDGSVVLNTQGLPYSINGVGDLLALFRCISCKFKFGTSLGKPQQMGAVGRVFSSGEPEMSHNVQRYDKHVYLRVAEAQRCRVHSTLFMPLFSSPKRDRCLGVFEVVLTDQDAVFSALVDWLRVCLEGIGLSTSEVDGQALAVGLRTFAPHFEASAYESGVEGRTGQPSLRAAAKLERGQGTDAGPAADSMPPPPPQLRPESAAQGEGTSPRRAASVANSAPHAGHARMAAAGQQSFGQLAAAAAAASHREDAEMTESEDAAAAGAGEGRQAEVVGPSSNGTAGRGSRGTLQLERAGSLPERLPSPSPRQVHTQPGLGSGSGNGSGSQQQRQQQQAGAAPGLGAPPAVGPSGRQANGASAMGLTSGSHGSKPEQGTQPPSAQPSPGSSLHMAGHAAMAAAAMQLLQQQGLPPEQLAALLQQQPVLPPQLPGVLPLDGGPQLMDGSAQGRSLHAGHHHHHQQLQHHHHHHQQQQQQQQQHHHQQQQHPHHHQPQQQQRQQQPDFFPFQQQDKSFPEKYGQGNLTVADLQAQFGYGLKEAAGRLGICPTTLKRACRRLGIPRWPRRQLVKMSKQQQATQERGGSDPAYGSGSPASSEDGSEGEQLQRKPSQRRGDGQLSRQPSQRRDEREPLSRQPSRQMPAPGQQQQQPLSLPHSESLPSLATSQPGALQQGLPPQLAAALASLQQQGEQQRSLSPWQQQQQQQHGGLLPLEQAMQLLQQQEQRHAQHQQQQGLLGWGGEGRGLPPLAGAAAAAMLQQARLFSAPGMGPQHRQEQPPGLGPGTSQAPLLSGLGLPSDALPSVLRSMGAGMESLDILAAADFDMSVGNMSVGNSPRVVLSNLGGLSVLGALSTGDGPAPSTNFAPR